MDITGARWGLSGAEAILRLRALYSSIKRAPRAVRSHRNLTRADLSIERAPPPLPTTVGIFDYLKLLTGRESLAHGQPGRSPPLEQA
jgi:hypothetical protein